MSSGGQDVAYYTLPVILSFDGVEKQAQSKLGKALGGIGGKVGKSFAKDVGDGIKAGESDVKRALDGYTRLYDKAADQAGKLKTAEAGLEDLRRRGVSSGQRYVRLTEQAEKAQRDHNRALRDARDAYGDYEKAAKSAADAGEKVGGGLLDKLKGAAGSAKSSGGEAATGFLEGFGGPIASIGTKAGPIGIALAAAAALGIAGGSLIGKQVMAGLEQEAQRDVVQAKLGIDESSMKKLADSAGAAYGENFGGSVQENLDAAASAIQSGLLSGADDPNSKVVIERLSTVRDLLGEDIPRVARSASQLVRTGMAKDFEQAFDLIVRGSQNGLNVSEDLLDTLDEYSTQWRKLGLSGPEAMGLLSQAVKGGARDTDVAADALKEFSIRAVDGSKTTTAAFETIGLNAGDMQAKFLAGGQSAHDAMAQTFDALQRVQDPVVKNNALLGLFGTQFEDLGSALGQFDLSHAVEQFGAVDGSAQKAADTIGDNAVGSIETAKRAFELGSNSMQESLANAFGPSLEQGANFLTAHKDDIAQGFNWMAGAATEFGAAVTGVGGGLIYTTGLIVGAIGDTVGFVLDGFEQLTKGAAVVADAMGADGLALELRRGSAELGVISDQFHGWGEGLMKTGGDVQNFAIGLHNLDTSLASTQQSGANAAAQIEHVKEAVGALPGGKNININAIVTFKDTSGLVISPDQLRTPAYVPAVPGETHRPRTGRASGGGIAGPGGPTSDIIPIWASNGEHMLPADEVDMLGGQSGVYRMRSLIRAGAFQKFAGGGAIGLDALYEEAQNLLGRQYSMSAGDDCSGTISQLVNAALGLPPKADRMSTATAAKWLAGKGALSGEGPAGTLRIGWKNGGPGGGHMAATLPDGTNVEMGGASGGYQLGGSAAGADDPQFTDHAFLPIEALYPDGQASGNFASPYGSAGGTGGAGGVPGYGPNGEAGTYSAPDAKAVRDAQQKVTDADTRVKEAEAKQRELEADAKESQKISAQADVDKAKREAADARTDLTEVQKGKFSAGKAGKSGSGSGGDNPLKEILGIVGGGLKETFGIGSWLPDIADLMPVKMAETLLGTALPMASAYASGDWQPGGLLGDALGTSSAPFGMPDVAVPPPPAGSPASGAGAGPLPGPPIQVDASTNIAGNVGWDKRELDRERDSNLHRAVARIPV